MGDDLLDTRRRVAQRAADIADRVAKQEGKVSEPTRRDSSTSTPKGANTEQARSTKRVGSQGEPAFGAPIQSRDNSVAQLNKQQHTDVQNSTSSN